MTFKKMNFICRIFGHEKYKEDVVMIRKKPDAIEFISGYRYRCSRCYAILDKFRDYCR